MTNVNSIAENLAKLRAQLSLAEKASPWQQKVQLLAVSKGQKIDKIQAALAEGQYQFGENYLQEALAKIAAIAHPQLEWHFIGTVQSNKTAAIAQHFSWVHSVNRLKIAQRLSAQRSAQLPPLNVCIEVNVSADPNKTGAAVAAVTKLAEQIVALPQLRLRGLMTITQQGLTDTQQREAFGRLRLLQTKLQQQGFALDTLSMGMSADFALAIAEGATLVRIGTAIFGERDQ